MVHKMRDAQQYLLVLLRESRNCACGAETAQGKRLRGPFKEVLVRELHIQQNVSHLFYLCTLGFVRMEFQHHHRECVSSDRVQVPF